MPGIFGLFDFTKPGKGVEKDAPSKARFLIFLEIFFRKFWNLIKINFMFFLFNIPAFIIGFFISYLIMPQGLIPLENQLVTAEYAAIGEVYFRFIIGLIFCVIPIVTVGPFQCGFTYILRNYAKEEHAFIWGDFKEHAKNNRKQALAVSIIDLILLCIILFALSFYYTQDSSVASFIFGIVCVGLVIFFMMHIFIYPMLVTFHVTLKQLYTNCFKFALFKFLPNTVILIICGLVTLLPFIIPVYGYVIGSILLILITLSFTGLLTNFYAYPLLKKYMIDKRQDINNHNHEEALLTDDSKDGESSFIDSDK